MRIRLIILITTLVTFKLLKATESTGFSLKELYKKTILKAWCLGFVADITGAIPLFLGFAIGITPFKIPHEITSAVAMNPFSNIWAFLLLLYNDCGVYKTS